MGKEGRLAPLDFLNPPVILQKYLNLWPGNEMYRLSQCDVVVGESG